MGSESVPEPYLTACFLRILMVLLVLFQVLQEQMPKLDLLGKTGKLRQLLNLDSGSTPVEEREGQKPG